MRRTGLAAHVNNCLIFDIETVPDTELGAQELGLTKIPDDSIAQAMFFHQAQKSGSEFLPLHQHRVVAISVVLRNGEDFKVLSLGEPDSDEAELVRLFFDGVAHYQPTLVSWNGSGFDLPVLHYRALKHGVRAPAYWDVGEHNREARFNNYLGRFHWRHIDVMDVLAGYQARAKARLDVIATMLGFPGKMGMSGAHVWDAFRAGEIDAIRNYCETDVLNTYLVFLRFQYMRGELTDSTLKTELQVVRDALAAAPETHLQEFLSAWNEGG
ncbi:MAG: 3'-5' exonuclease [Gammaproteobacteria bacterium]|nr:3'-5' exonuclease [Gammaproteobacteria bacterium]NND54751.1 3'-5' exonuclease [Gammaproteobacteria bacterium]